LEPDEQTNERTEFWSIITGSPWVCSIIVLAAFGISALQLGYGQAYQVVDTVRLMAPILVLIIMRWILGRESLCDRVAPSGISNIAWSAALWVTIVIYFGGLGISSYIPEVVSTWPVRVVSAIGLIMLFNSTRDGIRVGWSDLGFRRSCLPRTLGYLTVICTMFGPVIVGALWAGAFVNLTVMTWISLLITSTMMPAFFEEITYRGLIQEAFAAKYGSRLSGLFMASLFFGIAHIFTDSGEYNDIVLGILLCFASQFIAGLVLGAVYEATGNLAASMVLHYLYNFRVWVYHVSSYQGAATSYTWLGLYLAFIMAFLVAAWSRIRRRVRISRGPIVSSEA